MNAAQSAEFLRNHLEITDMMDRTREALETSEPALDSLYERAAAPGGLAAVPLTVADLVVLDLCLAHARYATIFAQGRRQIGNRC